MKAYIVTAGEYSDYHIHKVFLDKDLAERYVRTLRFAPDSHYSFERDAILEEYDIENTDQTKDMEIANYVYISATFDIDNNLHTCYVEGSDEDDKICEKDPVQIVDINGSILSLGGYVKRRQNETAEQLDERCKKIVLDMCYAYKAKSKGVA